MKPLTDRQRMVLTFVEDYGRRQGDPPTVREVAAHLGVQPRAAADHLAALKRKGYLHREPGRPRGLALVLRQTEPVVEVPVLDRIIAFDGANIWVANNGSGTVSKLQVSTGIVLGTFTVGSFPHGIAFDGANIWVTMTGSGTVTKIEPSTGIVLGTYAVGAQPIGIAFDGANVWVANTGGNTVSKR